MACFKIVKSSLVFIIIVLGAALRLLGLWERSVFSSSDEVMQALAALDIFNLYDAGSVAGAMRHFLRLLAVPWGCNIVILNSAFLGVFTLLGIPVTEFTVVLPHVVIGCVSIYAVYLLGSLLHSEGAGLIGAFFTAVMPIHILSSRITGSITLTGSIFCVASVLCFVRYFRTQRSLAGSMGGVLLGLYIGWDGQFPAIALLIVLTGIIMSDGTPVNRLRRTLKLIFRRNVLFVPLAVTAVHVLVWLWFAFSRGDFYSGFIGHILSKKSAHSPVPGIFWQSLMLNTSPWFVLLSLAACIRGICTASRRRSLLLLTLWAVLYLVPWLAFVGQSDTSWRIYYIAGLIPLSVLAGGFIVELSRSAGIRVIGLLSGCVLTLAVGVSLLSRSLCQVHNLWCKDPVSEYYYGRAVRSNSGIKTAGFFAREQVEDSERVFTDFGIPLVKYYFHRMPVAEKSSFWNFSANEEKFRFLDEVIDELDYLFIRRENAGRAAPYLEKGFHKAAVIHQDGEPLIFVYARRRQKCRFLDVARYDALFDEKYGNALSLRVPAWFSLEVF